MFYMLAIADKTVGPNWQIFLEPMGGMTTDIDKTILEIFENPRATPSKNHDL